MVSIGKSDDGQTEKVQKQGTMKDLLNSLEDQIKPFFFHYLINKEHTKVYNKCRQDATETNSNKAMIQMDFSENFTCCYQDEVASTHWKTSSVTLYTVMIWFIDCSKSMVLLSDNNNDKTTVVPYTLHIIKAVMDLFGDEIKEIDFWTDGSSSQYKNKYVFAFIGIKLPEIFPSLKICCNYSATSCGKGAVDGVGGTIKHLATRAIIIRKAIITRKAILNNADSLLKAVQDKTKTILAIIDESQMKEILSDMEIPSLQEKLNAVPGIKHVHCIEPSELNSIKTCFYCEDTSFTIDPLLSIKNPIASLM